MHVDGNYKGRDSTTKLNEFLFIYCNLMAYLRKIIEMKEEKKAIRIIQESCVTPYKNKSLIKILKITKNLLKL